MGKLDAWDIVCIILAAVYFFSPVDFVPGFIGDDIAFSAVIYVINRHRRKRLK